MRVVATLTTRPNYHENFNICLDSLIGQFDDVYLGLPKVSRKGEIYKKFEYKSVKVVELEEDIGPATKILAGFIMEKDRDSLIVSVDDDNKYDSNLRKSLEKQRLEDIKNNENRVITNAGHYIKYWSFGILGLNGGGVSCSDRFFDFNRIKKLTKLSGFGGVAYPRSVIDEIDDFVQFIKNVVKIDPDIILHDDISISAYLSEKKIDIILNPERNKSVEKFLSKGENSKDFIGEDHKSILKYSNKLKKYFKNNPKKKFSLVILDLFIFIIVILILVTTFRLIYFRKN